MGINNKKISKKGKYSVFRKPLNIFVKLLTGLKPVFRGALKQLNL
jgi:hypothetical protein